MPQAPKYYIVEANALPEIYLKVAEAKRLMETGEVATVNAATRQFRAEEALPSLWEWRRPAWTGQ